LTIATLSWRARRKQQNATSIERCMCGQLYAVHAQVNSTY